MIRRRVTYTRGYFSLVSLMYGKRLVIPQQDVEARLPLLDEIVFERQRLFVVVDQDVFDVAGVGDQRSGLGVGQPVVGEVAAHAGAQVLGLAHVDHFAVLVFVQIHAGQQGQLGGFFPEFHFEGGYFYCRRMRQESCRSGRCELANKTRRGSEPPRLIRKIQTDDLIYPR